MKNFFITLMILININCIAQNIQELLPEPQLRVITVDLYKLPFIVKQNQELKKQVDVYKKQIDIYKAILDTCNSTKKNMDIIGQIDSTILKKKDEQLELSKKSLEVCIKADARKDRKIRKMNNIIRILSAITIIQTTYIILR